MASVYGIPEGQSIGLPEQQIDETARNEERAIAKLLDSKEWKELRKHFESRKKFYQSYLPGGREVNQVSPEEAGKMWMVANAVIAEIDAVIITYEEIARSVRGE